jgi:hypothetical protein
MFSVSPADCPVEDHFPGEVSNVSPTKANQMKTKNKENQLGRSLRAFAVAAGAIIVLSCSASLRAQNLGWEGETGIFITPLAYTAGAEGKVVEPVIGFHFLDAGPVIGQFYEASITVGLGKRFEVGYTSDMHAQGGNVELSPLWHDSFNVFHGKAVLIPENYKKQAWMPAISVGFMARTQVHNVGGAIMNQDTSNGDVYLVATKTVTQTKPIPVVLSAGVRGTDAELWGMGGNAPNWQARGFGAVAFVFKAPRASTIILGVELSQQPLHPQYLPTANFPTSLVYAIRFVPTPKQKLNVDFGIAQIAGQISPGVNLQARSQVGVQVSYGF